MTERVPEYVFHQFENLFDTMDGAYFGEAEISGILDRAKRDGIYPGADYVYRCIQYLQIRLREEKEKVLHQKRKRCLAMAWWCSAELGMLVSTWEFKIKHYKKWQRRWLELAQKFKEAK